MAAITSVKNCEAPGTSLNAMHIVRKNEVTGDLVCTAIVSLVLKAFNDGISRRVIGR